jgi:hypothetical protein
MLLDRVTEYSVVRTSEPLSDYFILTKDLIVSLNDQIILFLLKT